MNLQTNAYSRCCSIYMQDIVPATGVTYNEVLILITFSNVVYNICSTHGLKSGGSLGNSCTVVSKACGLASLLYRFLLAHSMLPHFLYPDWW